MSSPAASAADEADLADVTKRSLDAFLTLHPPLTRLDCHPHAIVLLYPSTHPIALISGGGDGHQPAHAGYLGLGMLNAAVSGSVFASPSPSSILLTLRHLHPRPALLIVKNYTGDRLNFALALHQHLSSLSLTPSATPSPHPSPTPATPTAAMVIVGDDVALPRHSSLTGRRGLAGTVLVHKIAGAAAGEGGGMDLRGVEGVAREVAARLCTVGVAFSGAGWGEEAGKRESWGHGGEMEVGVGIHGEPGVGRERRLPLVDIVPRLLDMLLSTDPDRDYFHREARGGEENGKKGKEEEAREKGEGASGEQEGEGDEEGVRVVLLVNNLHGLLEHEMALIADATVRGLWALGVAVERLVQGRLMTAWRMRGFSLTLLRLPSSPSARGLMLRRLHAPTDAPAWPHVSPHSPRLPTLLPPPPPPPIPPPSPAADTASSSRRILQAVRAAATALIQHEGELNRLDGLAGDGDCGSTLARAGRGVLEVGGGEGGGGGGGGGGGKTWVREVQRVVEGMGGTSGAVWSLLLLAAGEGGWGVEGWMKGAEVVREYGGAWLDDRTLLDALVPALQAFSAGGWAAAVVAAKQGVERTKGMHARAGRASYVPSSALQEADPGAMAVMIIIEALAGVLDVRDEVRSTT